MERAVTLEHGQQLVAALELLEGDRMALRPVPPVPAADRIRPGQARIERPNAGRQLLQVTDPGVWSDDDPGPDHLGPPAQVEVLSHADDRGVEAAQLVEEVSPDQGRSTGGDEHVTHRVVLAMVDLIDVDPVHHGAALVDHHPHMDQALGVVPAHHLRRDHAGVRSERLFHHQMDGIGEEGHIVVADEVVRGPFHHGAHLVHRGPEPSVFLEASHVGGGEHGGHPGGQLPGTAGIQDQDRQLRVVL